jgi:hypothetical protein
MAAAVIVGFTSHLLLDEICSVDLRGARVNKAFGTALKLWAPSPWTTLAMYGFLTYLTWQVIQTWPPGPLELAVPADPKFPFKLEWPEGLDSRVLSPDTRWRVFGR